MSEAPMPAQSLGAHQGPIETGLVRKPNTPAGCTRKPTGGVEWIYDHAVDAAGAADQGQAFGNGPLPHSVGLCRSCLSPSAFPLCGRPHSVCFKTERAVKGKARFGEVPPAHKGLEAFSRVGGCCRTKWFQMTLWPHSNRPHRACRRSSAVHAAVPRLCPKGKTRKRHVRANSTPVQQGFGAW